MEFLVDELINLVPLVRDELSNIRYELHKSMIKSVISDTQIGDKTYIEEIKARVSDKFCLVDFPDEVLVRIIDEFEEDGVLQKIDNNYIIKKAIDMESIDSFIANCYSEFKIILKENINEFDVFIHKEYESAFKDSILYIINNLINEESLINNFSLDSLKYGEICSDLRSTLIKYETIKKPDQFLSLFFNYLKSGKKNITDLLFTVYLSSIAYDLLKRGRDLPKIAEDIGKGGVLFLDTNVIVSLICETDRTNELAKSIIELAKNKFNFDLKYYIETAKEYENLLKWADSEMKSKHLPNKLASENQLIHDFLKRNDRTWSDHYTELSMYRTILKNFHIDMYDDNLVLSQKEKDIFSYVEVIYSYEFQQSEGKKERSYEAIAHDKDLFKLMIFLKKENMVGLNTPWILSLDNKLNRVNQTLIKLNKFDIPPSGYSIHPRTLLNTLLVFANMNFDDDKRRDIVKSIVNYLIIPPTPLTEEQYAKLVTYKVPGLNERDVETIIHFLRISPLKSRLDKALEDDDIDSASQIFNEMTLDQKVIDALISERKTKEENERLRQALSKVRLEKQALVEATKPTAITLNINMSGIDPITEELIRVLLTQIKKAYPDIYREANADTLESKEITKDKINGTLDVIDKCINKGSDVATKMQPILGLISLIRTTIGV